MPYYSNYHLREQEAYALLGPVRDALRELEGRTRHYAERLAMAPAERETVQAAHRAIAAACAEVERLRATSDAGRRAEVSR